MFKRKKRCVTIEKPINVRVGYSLVALCDNPGQVGANWRCVEYLLSLEDTFFSFVNGHDASCGLFPDKGPCNEPINIKLGDCWIITKDGYLDFDNKGEKMSITIGKVRVLYGAHKGRIGYCISSRGDLYGVQFYNDPAIYAYNESAIVNVEESGLIPDYKLNDKVKILKSAFKNQIGKNGHIIGFKYNEGLGCFEYAVGGLLCEDGLPVTVDGLLKEDLELYPQPKFKIGDKVKFAEVPDKALYMNIYQECNSIIQINKMKDGTYLYNLESIVAPRYHLHSIKEDNLELYKEPKPTPEINMVAKCIDNDYSDLYLTIGKYYPVDSTYCDNDRIRIEDDKNRSWEYFKHKFITFKVGDRFKFKKSGNMVQIEGFVKDEILGLMVHYIYIDNDGYKSSWDIEHFNKATTKIAEDLQVGDWVEVVKETNHLSRNIDTIGNIGQICEIIPNSSKGSVRVNIKGLKLLYLTENLKKVDKPKPEFKVGDWVEVLEESDIIRVSLTFGKAPSTVGYKGYIDALNNGYYFIKGFDVDRNGWYRASQFKRVDQLSLIDGGVMTDEMIKQFTSPVPLRTFECIECKKVEQQLKEANAKIEGLNILIDKQNSLTCKQNKTIAELENTLKAYKDQASEDGNSIKIWAEEVSKIYKMYESLEKQNIDLNARLAIANSKATELEKKLTIANDKLEEIKRNDEIFLASCPKPSDFNWKVDFTANPDKSLPLAKLSPYKVGDIVVLVEPDSHDLMHGPKKNSLLVVSYVYSDGDIKVYFKTKINDTYSLYANQVRPLKIGDQVKYIDCNFSLMKGVPRTWAPHRINHTGKVTIINNPNPPIFIEFEERNDILTNNAWCQPHQLEFVKGVD